MKRAWLSVSSPLSVRQTGCSSTLRHISKSILLKTKDGNSIWENWNRGHTDTFIRKTMHLHLANPSSFKREVCFVPYIFSLTVSDSHAAHKILVLVCGGWLINANQALLADVLQLASLNANALSQYLLYIGLETCHEQGLQALTLCTSYHPTHMQALILTWN